MFFRNLAEMRTLRYTYDPDHFNLSADGISLMNTIALRDQFKPTRIGENLVVNYRGWYCLSAEENYRVTWST